MYQILSLLNHGLETAIATSALGLSCYAIPALTCTKHLTCQYLDNSHNYMFQILKIHCFECENS